MKYVASLRYGVIFKKAFGDVEVFTHFVKDFLGISLEIDQVETEKSFDPPIGNVDSRFDLYAEDKKKPCDCRYSTSIFLRPLSAFSALSLCRDFRTSQ